jgi:hypothetical protein
MLMSLAATSFADDSTELSRRVSEWRTAKQKADRLLSRTFGQRIEALKRSHDVSPEVRNAKIEVLKDQKSRFENEYELPNYDNMLPATIQYLDLLHEAATPMRKWFDQALEDAVGSGEKYDTLAAAKKTWQSELPGRDEFGPNTEFHGTNTFLNGKTVDCHLDVWNINGNVFVGQIWQNTASVPDKTGWQYEARLEGNQFLLETTKMIHGNPLQVSLRGYVIGRRIIMKITHLDGKPKQSGYISLWKK